MTTKQHVHKDIFPKNEWQLLPNAHNNVQKRKCWCILHSHAYSPAKMSMNYESVKECCYIHAKIVPCVQLTLKVPLPQATRTPVPAKATELPHLTEIVGLREVF